MNPEKKKLKLLIYKLLGNSCSEYLLLLLIYRSPITEGESQI
jgi:hypothetical protein